MAPQDPYRCFGKLPLLVRRTIYASLRSRVCDIALQNHHHHHNQQQHHSPPPPSSKQAVDAAVETLKAYLSSRSTMGAEEGAALASALAERALCCGRGPVEDKAISAAEALLSGVAGELAQRGAWLTLAARAGSLENMFFPPPLGEDGERARTRVMVAAAAPKAVTGCVKAMSSALGKDRGRGGGGGGGVAGGEEARNEVGFH